MFKQLHLKTMALLGLLLAGAGSAWADEEPSVLFHESFGDNTGSARAWDNSYSVKSGVSAVYEGITGYTVTNAKQGKNTTGSTKSGLNQSTQNTDAVIIIGPLNVANYNTLKLTYQWNAASVKGTYTTSAYYATSSDGTYNELTGTGTGATSFVERSYSLPAAAQVATLYLKIVWNTSNTQAIIDEVELTGIENADEGSVKKPVFSLEEGAVYYGTSVSLSQEDGKTIKYTTDGTAPTAESTTYTSPIAITSKVTIKAIAIDGSDVSSVASASYTLKNPEAPVFSRATGKVNAGTEITLTAATGCVLSYTTDGTDPAESATAILTDNNTSTVTINATQTVRAIAIDGAANESTETSATYTVAVVDVNAMTEGRNSFDAASGTLGTDITYEALQGKAANAPFLSSGAIRLYQNGGYITLTAPASFKITDVTITTTGTYKSTTVNYTVDDKEDYAGENETVAALSNYDIEGLNNSKVSVYCLGTDKNTRLEIAAISVTYVGTASMTLASACTDGTNFYGTYSNTHAFVVPADLTVSEITVVDGELLVESYATGDVVPANTGVMVAATSAGEKAITLTGRIGTSKFGTDNMLKASSVAMTGDCLFYRLTMHNGTQIGFWWGAAEGAAFDIAANKAYLAVPNTVGGARAGFALFGDDTTAIGSMSNEQCTMNSGIYDLQGRRMDSSLSTLHSPLLKIVNGRKVLVK